MLPILCYTARMSTAREKRPGYQWLVDGVRKGLGASAVRATVELVEADYGNRLDLHVELDGKRYARAVDGEVGYRDPITGEEWWRGYRLNGDHFDEGDEVRNRVVEIAVAAVTRRE